MIVRDERTGKSYGVDYMQKLHKRIREEARRIARTRRDQIARIAGGAKPGNDEYSVAIAIL